MLKRKKMLTSKAIKIYRVRAMRKNNNNLE